MADDDGIERWPFVGAWLYSLVWGSPRSNREVVALAAPSAGTRVLDIGCGPGAAVRRAARAGADALGVDPSPAMVRIAERRSRRHPGASFAAGHAADLPVDDASIDVAWTIAAFHHWPDTDAGLSEVARVLAPGGRLLIGEKRLRKEGGHGLTPDGTTRLLADLERHGFGDATTTDVRLVALRMTIIEARA